MKTSIHVIVFGNSCCTWMTTELSYWHIICPGDAKNRFHIFINKNITLFSQDIKYYLLYTFYFFTYLQCINCERSSSNLTGIVELED